MNLDFINNFKCSIDNLTLWVRLAASQFLVTSRIIWPCLYQGQISLQDSLRSLLSLRKCPLTWPPTQVEPLTLLREALIVSKWSLITLLIMVRLIRISTDQARELTAALKSITCLRMSIQVPTCTCMALLLTTTILKHTCNQLKAAWAPIAATELPNICLTCHLMVTKDLRRHTIIPMPCLSVTGRKGLLWRIVRRKRILMMIATIMWE